MTPNPLCMKTQNKPGWFWQVTALLLASGYRFDVGLAEAVPEGPTTLALCEVAAKKRVTIVAGVLERGDHLVRFLPVVAVCTLIENPSILYRVARSMLVLVAVTVSMTSRQRQYA